MPATYPPEAVREACQLFMSGLNYEDVARQMRAKGYASYSVETIKRWATERGWDKDRARFRAEEASLAAALDVNRQTAEMLSSYIKLRGDLQAKRENKEIEFTEAINLQLKIDSLIRQLLAQRRQTVEQVDKPAFALEVVRLILEYLSEEDPLALEGLQPHIEDLGELIKERFAEAA